MAGIRVGIDFGTSNSGVAWYDGSNVHLLPIDPSNVDPGVVKSVLYITSDHQAYIGQEAISYYYQHNINRMRRFVKKRYGEIDYHGSDGMFYVRDIFVLVDELMPGRLLQFIKTGLRSDGYGGTLIFDKYYSLTDIIRVYLGELKRRAERLLETEISGVTLGRPVKFYDDPQKDQRSQNVLREAALQAGFGDVDFEFEPVAAALYYELSLRQPENVLIFDFGGGTLDITVMRLGDPRGRQVFSSGGIGIAGSDFDRAIIERRMLEHFGRNATDDIEIDTLIGSISDWQVLPQLSTPEMKARLERAAVKSKVPTRLKALEALIFNDLSFQFYNKVEAAKILLSTQASAEVKMQAENLHIWELLTRLQFEADIADYMKRIEACLAETVANSGLRLDQIDTVIRTGGSSSIPAFIAMLERTFGVEKVRKSDLFGSVTSGLAIRAAQAGM
jgi:hypothetical chaperone protein